ncbi:MAG: hypothetical protein R2824_16455 [Saprospiraceae bacterium]
MAFAGAGLGASPGATGLVPGDGGVREVRQIRNLSDLDAQLTWPEERHTIGYILQFGGSRFYYEPGSHLDMLYDAGLRALGPAHYGPGTYASGTDSSGGIGEKTELCWKLGEKSLFWTPPIFAISVFGKPWTISTVRSGPAITIAGH